ncbi:MAG: sporulation protein YqfD [Lachnospiraceae bacterium]
MKAQNFNRLFGMYDLVLYGARLERFFNIVAFRGIDIRSITYRDEEKEELQGLSAHAQKQCRIRIKREDYEELIGLCAKYNIEVKQKRALGIPAVVNYYRNRVAFYVGALGCFLFLLGMSHCVWEIEIKGNSFYTEETLLDYLRERHITYGCFSGSFSCEKEELALRKSHDRIAWCSMSVEGCKLILTVTENKLFEKERQGKSGWSIVADNTAIISSIVTRTGTPLVKQNEKVKKGQILVAGYLIYKDDFDTNTGVQKCVADADIYGVYKRKVLKSVPLIQQSDVVEHTEQAWGVLYGERVIGRKLPFHRKENEAVLTEYRQHPYLSRILPGCYRLDRTKYFYKKTKVSLSKDEAALQAENEMEQYCKKIEEKGCKIIEKNLQLEHNKKEVVLSGTLTIQKRFCTYKQTKVPEIGKE